MSRPGNDTPQPFVGVCGIQSAADYQKLLEYAQLILPSGNYFLMAGVEDSRVAIDPSYLSDSVQPFVHCDFNAREPFDQTVAKNIERTRRYVCGVQLNLLPWMHVDAAPLVAAIKRQAPHIKIVLQAHEAIMSNYTPAEIAKRLSGLAVDYILFDASQGRGMPYNPKDMNSYVATVHAQNPHIGIVVSGGLYGGNLKALFGQLAVNYPALSCDASSRLRSKPGRLVWPAVYSYLHSWQSAVSALAPGK